MNIKSIDEFPNEEARKIQEQLIELDKQGVLKQHVIDDYKRKNVRPSTKWNTLLPFCLNTWDYYGKTLYMEYTGLILDENNNIIDNISITRTHGYKNKNFLWKCIECGSLWVGSINDRMLYTCSCDTCRKKYKIRNEICKAKEIIVNKEPNKPIINKKPQIIVIGTTRGTSFPEQFLYNCFKQLYPNTLNRYKDNWCKYEYDIAILEINLYIEYSGYYWHQNKLNRDRAKELNCIEHNVRFIEIYEFIKEVDTLDIVVNNYITIVRTPSDEYINKLKEIVKYILNKYVEAELINKIDFESAEEEAKQKMKRVIEIMDNTKCEESIPYYNISYLYKNKKEEIRLSYEEVIELSEYYKEHKEIERRINSFIENTNKLRDFE